MHLIIAHYMWLNNEHYFNGEPQFQKNFKHTRGVSVCMKYI